MKDGTLSSLVLAGCVTVAGWMGYGMIHGQDDTPKDLTALVVDDEAREMSPTLYAVDKHAHHVDLSDENAPI